MRMSEKMEAAVKKCLSSPTTDDAGTDQRGTFAWALSLSHTSHTDCC